MDEWWLNGTDKDLEVAERNINKLVCMAGEDYRHGQAHKSWGRLQRLLKKQRKINRELSKRGLYGNN